MDENNDFEWIPPSNAELKVIQAKRERGNKISSIMGKYLLKGYKMLATTCSICDCILMEDKMGELYCIACCEVDDSDTIKDNPAVSDSAAKRTVEEDMHRRPTRDAIKKDNVLDNGTTIDVAVNTTNLSSLNAKATGGTEGENFSETFVRSNIEMNKTYDILHVKQPSANKCIASWSCKFCKTKCSKDCFSNAESTVIVNESRNKDDNVLNRATLFNSDDTTFSHKNHQNNVLSNNFVDSAKTYCLNSDSTQSFSATSSPNKTNFEESTENSSAHERCRSSYSADSHDEKGFHRVSSSSSNIHSQNPISLSSFTSCSGSNLMPSSTIVSSVKNQQNHLAKSDQLIKYQLNAEYLRLSSITAMEQKIDWANKRLLDCHSARESKKLVKLIMEIFKSLDVLTSHKPMNKKTKI